MFEMLESRSMLSATVNQYGSLLVVEGGRGDDLITVREDSGAVHVEYYNRQGVLQSRDVNGITAIKIRGNAGDDSIFYTGNTVGADIHGDDGDNNSHGGSSGGTGHRGCGGSSGGTGHWRNHCGGSS